MEGGAGQPVVRRWEQEEVGGKEEARWGEEQPMGVCLVEMSGPLCEVRVCQRLRKPWPWWAAERGMVGWCALEDSLS